MNATRKPGLTLLLGCLLAAALAVRLLAACWWQSRLPEGTLFAFGDSDTYWQLGRALAKGEPFQYGSPDSSVFRMPGYPLLLAGLFKVAGDNVDVFWARALSAVCGTLGVLATFWLARRLFDRRVGLLAGAIVALYPGAIGMSVYVLSEALFCALMLAQLSLTAASWQRTTARDRYALALAAGAMSGLATLVRPSWWLFLPFATLLAVIGSKARSAHLLWGLTALVGLAAVMFPWWLRSSLLTGHFVPTTLQVGASLYDGWNENADGSSQMDFVAPFTVRERARWQRDPGENFEWYLDRRFSDEAISWARAHPARVMQLAGVKFLRMWNIWPNEPAYRSWPVRLAVLVTYVPLLVLGLWGVWRFRMLGWPYVLCLLPAVYFTLLHVIFVSSIRYRDPALLPLAVMASAAVLKQPRRVD